MASLRDRFNGNGLAFIARLAGRTCRYQVDGWEKLAALKAENKPVVLTTWHGMTMMLASFFRHHFDVGNVVLLMPDDWRGMALEIFAGQLGARPFPMPLDEEVNMQTARRLAQLVRQVREGRDCYITPDGPDGPAYVIKPGVGYIAKKAKAPIVPLGAYCRHGYRLARWDRYVVPYPYSRISIAVGEPMAVTKETDLTAVTHSLTNQLHRVAAQAAANYYEKRP